MQPRVTQQGTGALKLRLVARVEKTPVPRAAKQRSPVGISKIARVEILEIALQVTRTLTQALTWTLISTAS
jgi:hypothetical protein